MDKISKNIRNVMIIFLLLFLALICYMVYFQVFNSQKIALRQDNKILWAKRNEVLRGAIYDRNNKILVKSTIDDDGKQKREYLYGSIFAHVLGYENIKYGLSGLEYKYDKEMTSYNKMDILNVSNTNDDSNSLKKGYNLVTTLDYELQKYAYELLGNNKGAVVAMDPKNGEILAMVSKPSFDVNNLNSQWQNITSNDDKPLVNRATSGMYPPASTFKTITAVSSLENIKGILNRTFNDNGKLKFNDKEYLTNYNGEVLGNIDFKTAYAKSSNVVFGSLGLELGNTALRKTAEKFYFNREIPCEGLDISKSIFPKYETYEKGNIAQSAIGQGGVLATPMQMLMVVSSIANDGKMMEPIIMKQITNSKNEVVKKSSPKQIAQVTSYDNSQIIKSFMREVVEHGTGQNANIYGIDICGKTGTAEHSGDGKDHSWFIGFAPYNDPKIAVCVLVENGGEGGGIAAKISANIINMYLK